jgi:predicted transcriptional regulator of viral defense system
MQAESVSLLDPAQGKALLRPSDAIARGHSRMYLAQVAKRGLIHKVSRGLYALPQRRASEFASFAEVAIKHPQALVCLLSALAFHGLTTQAPFEVWIAVDNKARAPSMPSPPLHVARFSGPALTEGVELHIIEGVPVKITSVPKTISDCFKYRNKIGLDVAMKALRDAWSAKRVSMDELWHYGHICRVQNVMRPYLESITARSTS